MGTVFRREGSPFLWLRWSEGGEERRRSSKTTDRAEAAALLAEIERQAAECGPEAFTGPTVEQFYQDTWLPLRRRTAPFAWKTDDSRLRHHFLSEFGNRPIAWLGCDAGEMALVDWLVALGERKVRRDGTPLAARSILNTVSIVRVFLGDALERKVLRRDLGSTIRWAKYLPQKRDKVKGLRHRSFDLGQVVALTTDSRIPEDRRALYLLRFVGGGLRPSSESNLRWRDLDRTTRFLWRITVTGAFDSQAKVEKDTTKTGVPYVVPVHPVLQQVLERWWAEGWERFIGRSPTPDDLIVPRQDGTQRRVNVSLEQFYADLDALGLPRRRQYETRAAFRALCLRAGASEYHVRLITHPKPTSAAELYDRVEDQWEGMCAAVLCIDAGAWNGGPLAVSPERWTSVVAQVRAALSGADLETAQSAQKDRTLVNAEMKKPLQVDVLAGGRMVTRTGIEPMFSA